jgi:hypothetical protein
MTAKKERKQQRRAQRRKRQRAPQPAGQQILRQRIRKSNQWKDAPILVSPADTEKMSDVITRFAAPLKPPEEVLTAKTIQFAILVWNASLLPPREQRQALEDIANLVPDADRETRGVIQQSITMLLARKQQYFAHNRRFIVDYHIAETADMLSLNIVSTLVKASGDAGSSGV